MDKGSIAPMPTLTALGGDTSNIMVDSKSNKDKTSINKQASSARSVFLNLAINMTWQLAIVVLVPIVAGVKLDKAFDTGNLLLYIGLVLAVIGSIAVMWRTLKVANSIPVPKLTEAQKKSIKKSYEDEDKDD